MLKSKLLAEIQAEIYRHDFGTFVDELPTIAHGGSGVVVAGCPACKKRLFSMNQFLDHLAQGRDAVFIRSAVIRIVWLPQRDSARTIQGRTARIATESSQ